MQRDLEETCDAAEPARSGTPPRWKFPVNKTSVAYAWGAVALRVATRDQLVTGNRIRCRPRASVYSELEKGGVVDPRGALRADVVSSGYPSHPGHRVWSRACPSRDVCCSFS
jgi:hypothetical protein